MNELQKTTSQSEVEEIWFSGTELRATISFLKGKSHERKLKLFACACCRRINHLLIDDRSKRAIDVVEQFHEGRVTRQIYDNAFQSAQDAYMALSRDVANDEATPGLSAYRSILRISRMFAAQSVMLCFGDGYWEVTQVCCGALRGQGTSDVDESESRSAGEKIEANEQSAQVGLLHDIFGNPFHPIAIDSEWLTSTVLQLARQTYDSRDFSILPILADALQDAGCENEEMLNHCRQQTEHVRGCYVLDLLLGKK
jgi:hypothetical protein